jgi:polysaccharide biosynthesis protein PslH
VRVLWVSHIIPYPPKSGVHLRSFNLLRAVAASHEVDLLAFIQEQWLRVFYESPEQGLDECEHALESFCQSVRFLPIEKLRRPGGKWRTALESLVLPSGYTTRWLQGKHAREAFMRAAQTKYDLVHFDTIGLAPFRLLFDCRTATLGHHNIESSMLLRRASNESNVLKKAYFYNEGKRLQYYESKVAPTFNANITCSDLDSARLKQIAPAARTITIPNGVDVEYFSPHAGETSANTLVFVGSLNWYPNVDAVLFLLREIWPVLKSRIPQLRLDIVGSAPPPQLIEMAASLEGVQVHGFVEDVRPYIQRAAVYVCPIRDGGGTKLKLLDAFSMAKCVVAHPIACEGINAVAGVHVEHAGQALEFVEAIQRLLGDATRRNQMGLMARQLAVESYSFSRIGAQLAEVFRALAAGPRG